MNSLSGYEAFGLGVFIRRPSTEKSPVFRGYLTAVKKTDAATTPRYSKFGILLLCLAAK